MSSISADGGDVETQNCPTCGSEMEYDIIREAGTEQQTTLYEGWYCSTCRCGMVQCGKCESLHHPDVECDPKKKARLEAAKADYGGKAKMPGHGLVPVEELETIGEETPVYIIEGGCPEPGCDGDRIFEFIQKDNFAEGRRPEAEYQPVCDYCSKFYDSECGYREP